MRSTSRFPEHTDSIDRYGNSFICTKCGKLIKTGAMRIHFPICSDCNRRIADKRREMLYQCKKCKHIFVYRIGLFKLLMGKNPKCRKCGSDQVHKRFGDS